MTGTRQLHYSVRKTRCQVTTVNPRDVPVCSVTAGSIPILSTVSNFISLCHLFLPINRKPLNQRRVLNISFLGDLFTVVFTFILSSARLRLLRLYDVYLHYRRKK